MVEHSHARTWARMLHNPKTLWNLTIAPAMLPGMEFHITKDAHVPAPVFAAALPEIPPFAVSFSADHRSSGSGTLVTTHGHHPILTAAHVVDDPLVEEDYIGIAWTEHLRRFTIDYRHIASRRFRLVYRDDGTGPDLTCIHLLSYSGGRRTFGLRESSFL